MMRKIGVSENVGSEKVWSSRKRGVPEHGVPKMRSSEGIGARSLGSRMVQTGMEGATAGQK